MSRRHPEDPPGYNRRWPADRPVRVCSIDGCEKKTKSRGWCGMHYERFRVSGDPLVLQRATYGSTRRISAQGYIHLWEPKHPCAMTDGYVPEHRKVAYDAGLLVDLALEVHHRNGNKTDNRAENLEVLSRSEHARRHSELRRRVAS